MNRPAPSRLRPILTAAAAVAGALLAWWRFGGPWFAALAVLAGLLLALAVFRPRAGAAVFTVLERFTHVLLQSLTVLLLGVVFVLIFIPARLVLAIWRRDPLERRPDPAQSTYWRDPTRPGDAGRQFRTQF